MSYEINCADLLNRCLGQDCGWTLPVGPLTNRNAEIPRRLPSELLNNRGLGVGSGRQVSVEEMVESKPADDASLIR